MAYAIGAVLAGSEEDPCCCPPPPGDCCLYPFPSPDSPLYPDTDLPATVVITYLGNTGTFTKGSGYTYSGTIDGDSFTYEARADLLEWFLIFEGNPEIETNLLCLIGENVGFLVEDEFPATLTATQDGNPDTATCERGIPDQCTWYGGDWDPGSGEGFVTIHYGPIDGLGEPYKWNLNDDSGSFWLKDGDQNTPIGSYSPVSPATGNVTVS